MNVGNMRMSDEEREPCESAEVKLQANLESARKQLANFWESARELETASGRVRETDDEESEICSQILRLQMDFEGEIIDLRKQIVERVKEETGVDIIEQGAATDLEKGQYPVFRKQILYYHQEISELYRVGYNHSNSTVLLFEAAQVYGRAFVELHDKFRQELDELETAKRKVGAIDAEMDWESLLEDFMVKVEQINKKGSLDLDEEADTESRTESDSEMTLADPSL